VALDVTERVRAEEQLREEHRRKDEFLAMLAHELRNPLAPISSAAQLLRHGALDEARRGQVTDVIIRQVRHVAGLLDDLLDVGRVISGKILLARQRFDLGALVERLIGTLRVTGAMAQHTLVTGLQEVWVEADVTRIEQVVSNLLGNAAKYTPPGGRIEVIVRSEPAPDGEDGAPREAVLDVRDTGVGIAPELLPRVFDLFVQGERSLDRRAGGLGVGLTLVRRLVELHGGTVGVQSSAAGSTFRVRLPAQPTPVPSVAPSALPESRRRRITVIEDNQDALNALRSILELDGHTVSSATDGVSGLAALLKLRPDIAIVDIGLPGLTGLEVALRSRAAGFPGRMIAISGYGQESDVRQALKSGFDAHLVKPIDAAALRRLIAEN
jgi:nitrogen-specific signal transduction histidine kinase/CheY-like chemotaxis protein